jgi:hypothetical protein
MSGSGTPIRFYIYVESETGGFANVHAPTDESLKHFLCIYDSTSQIQRLFIDGVLEDSDTRAFANPLIKQSSDPLCLGVSSPTLLSANYKGKLPALAIYKDAEAQEIIDGDLDAWVAERYALASRLYALDNHMTEGLIHEWNGQDNIQFTAEGGNWKVASTATSYSLHTWNGLTIQIVPVEEGETYIMRWYAQLGQYDVANFATFDVTNSFFINNNESYAAHLNHHDLTMMEVEVVAPAGCTEIALSPFRGTDGPAEVILYPIVSFFKKNA